jgi:hypothetical protein
VKAADQFRSADVTKWGITALAVWGIAVLGANLSGLVPPSVYSALHASRLEGASVSQLRTQVAALEAESARAKRENSQLLARFNLNEDSTTAITKRVGALEVSLPKLVEQQLASTNIQKVDPTATGSIDKPITFEVDGGTVEVRQQPLTPGAPEVKFKAVPLASAMPAELAPDGASIGVGLGFPVAADEAEARWQELLAQAGTMLMGLNPVLAPADGTSNKLLIAGPITDKASALDLCKRLDSQGIPCQALPYAGDPLPLLN